MRWYGGSIVEAVNLSKKRNAIFVVYVEGDDPQSKSMTELIDSPEVSSRLGVEENFVAIKLISGSEAYTQFAQIYQLVPVPSIFFIGTTGTPLEVVAGSTAGGVSGLSSRIDNLTANKVGKTPSPAQLSEPAPSSAAAASSSAASSAFLAAEQGAIPKNKVWTEPAAKTAQPATNAKEEFDVVCEGEVCTRRPRLPSPVNSEGDIPTPSTNTSASTSIASPASTAAAVPPPTSTAAAPPTTSTDAASTTSSSSKPVPTPAAELNIDDKVERAKELIEKKRLEKMEEERKAEIEKELERRAQGAGMAELKRWQQEQEMKTLKEERMKEKKENEKIRARILEQIAQDRLDRQGKFGSPSDAPKPASPTTPTAPSPPADTSNVTRIQFKMPDGQTHTVSVSSESTLGELRQYVRANVERSGNFSLSTLYPRRCLTQAEDSQTMRTLGLSPNSAILLLRGDPDAPPALGSSVSKMGGLFGMLTSIFWSCVVNPANDLFRYVSNLITGQRARGRSSPDVTPGPPQGASAAAGGAQRRPTQQEDSAVKRRKTGGENSGSGMSTVRKDGNTYRLKDRDSDDENNTWNGNSTQQM